MAINRWLSTVRRLTRSRTSSGSPTGVEEGAGASLGFVVWMEQPATGRVTVEYATADDTAKAGEDYTATSGALAFEPGERKRTVSVPVLDDPHDEGEETMRLRLSNATAAGSSTTCTGGDGDDREHRPDAGGAGALRASDGRAGGHSHRGADGGAQAAGFPGAVAGRELQPGSERDF